jgi:hypothetical protein
MVAIRVHAKANNMEPVLLLTKIIAVENTVRVILSRYPA